MEIRVAGKSFDVDECREVVGGYCFGSQVAAWSPIIDEDLGPPPRDLETFRWAYRSYDCVPADDGDLTLRDVVVAQGINADLNVQRIAAVMAVADDVTEALAGIEPDERFWNLDVAEVDQTGSGLREQTSAWHMWRAWWLLMSLSGINVAITHKILHHKRPDIFPLIDNGTLAPLTQHGRGAWEQTLVDLQSSKDGYEELERWFEEQARDRQGVSLARLRIHDILTWCSVIGDWDNTREAWGSVR